MIDRDYTLSVSKRAEDLQHGSWFAGSAFIGVLSVNDIKISMDGKGVLPEARFAATRDNAFEP